MLKYADLSKGQKRCIDAFISLNPKLASAETITTKEVQKLFWDLHEKRTDGAPKIGYPLWLSANNTISRGVFAFPGPKSSGSVKDAVAKQTAAAKKKLEKIIEDAEPVSIDEDEFTAELRANGIQV
jgi:hypothetical protein